MDLCEVQKSFFDYKFCISFVLWVFDTLVVM